MSYTCIIQFKAISTLASFETVAMETSEFCFSLSQLINPDMVEGLVLLNIDPNGKGWIDWAASKVPLFDHTSNSGLRKVRWGFCVKQLSVNVSLLHL